jgi:hypothetical protein
MADYALTPSLRRLGSVFDGVAIPPVSPGGACAPTGTTYAGVTWSAPLGPDK